MLKKFEKDYKKRIQQALEDEYLRSTLKNFALSYKRSRGRAFDGLGSDFLRLELAEIKQCASTRLWGFYAQFKKHAERASAVVHMAKTSDEANESILRIARDEGGSQSSKIRVHDRRGNIFGIFAIL